MRLVSLTKVFGNARGISLVDLEVHASQVFGFLGPNGAGKSTTIRLMMGLYLPTAGRAQLFGLDAHRQGPDVRRRVGYLPGELALYPRLTGRETLDRIARMRGGVDPGFRSGLEERFGAELDRPVRTLSKGNRQKIGLIAAFMPDPELLVLDEPTSGLDPLLQREFAELLEESVARGRTVFLSSHDLAEVQRLAHRVAIIREGHLVALDTVEALRARHREPSSSLSETRSTRARSAGWRGLTSSRRQRVVPRSGSRVRSAPCLRQPSRSAWSMCRPAPPTWMSSSSATTPNPTECRAMSADVALLDLRLRRRSVLAYSIGLAAYTLLIVALYPSFKHDTAIDELTRSKPTLSALFGATGSLTTPAGWMNANLCANLLPLFALLMTIGYGAAAIAGQDEEGTLGGIAGLPLTRGQLLAEKVLALAAMSLPVPVVSLAATLAGRGFDVDLPLSALLQTTLLASGMAFDYGLVAVAIGAWTGRRGTALGITVALAAAAYVVSSMAPVVSWVHHLRYASPIYWSVGANQIHDGATLLGACLLVLLSAVASGLAYAGLRRLDIH